MRMSRVGLAALAVLAVAGCADLPLTTGSAYPGTGNPVNPTPLPGYRVRCETAPSVTNYAFDDYYSVCHEYIGPDGQVVVVRG